jgi:mannan endo-1,4-beta-mannosidase
LKSLGPQKLCIDGTYGVNKTHFSVAEIDIFSDHFYPLNDAILQEDIAAVETADRVYLAGEIDWTGLNGQTTPQGDTLESFYDIILARQNTSSPVVAGSLFWSLFMHDVPDCTVRNRPQTCEFSISENKLMILMQIYVNHTDGFTMQYGNPSNTAYTNGQISTVREHYFAMQNITVDSYLPSVACPHNYIPGYDAQYTYY